MMRDLQIGASANLVRKVDPTQTITLGALPQAAVFSTPAMIQLMEETAREVLRPFLDFGEESVGVNVQVEHLAAAPLGSDVSGQAVVTGIEKNRIDFELSASCGGRLIGRGTHRRAVIRLERLLATLNAQHDPGGLNSAPEMTEATAPRLDTVRVEQAGPVVTLILNRPASLNAVNRQMTADLESAVFWLNKAFPQVRVVILTGAGRAFCAGDDVKELEHLSAEEARLLSLRQASLYLAFERLPQPVIAAVNGPALGAGCVCANACDFRIAALTASFGMPEIKLGWPPGYGGAQLIARIGKSRALDLCLTGRTITPAQAREWGMLQRVVPANILLDAARQLAEELLVQPVEGLRATKCLLHTDEGPYPKLAHHLDTEAYVRCLGNPEARERIRAFAEKRLPRHT